MYVIKDDSGKITERYICLGQGLIENSGCFYSDILIEWEDDTMVSQVIDELQKASETFVLTDLSTHDIGGPKVICFTEDNMNLLEAKEPSQFIANSLVEKIKSIKHPKIIFGVKPGDEIKI